MSNQFPLLLHLCSLLFYMKLDDPTVYREAIGTLQYLTLTQPDIAFVVNRLSQFKHFPTIDHWEVVKCVIRYPASTVTHGLFSAASSPRTLMPILIRTRLATKMSIPQHALHFYLGKNPISWSLMKQKGATHSSTEAKYRTVANTSAKLRWIISFLTELGLKFDHVPTICCDNISATYLCTYPVFHSKHI